VDQQTEARKDEINREQEHSDVFGEVHSASILITSWDDNLKRGIGILPMRREWKSMLLKAS
jgi:hypothetical protein